jgi:TetR/AcrR family transcriptional repressor of nem operon
LTHGGFYKHFGSRDELVAEAAERAFADASQTIHRVTGQGQDPLAAFVDWYVSTEHRDDPGGGCAVAALVGDVRRADDRVRAGCRAVVEDYIEALEPLLGPGEDARRQATMVVSALVGSLTLARAVDDEALSREILDNVRETIKQHRTHSDHQEDS